jgi:hypothetical protein
MKKIKNPFVLDKRQARTLKRRAAKEAAILFGKKNETK